MSNSLQNNIGLLVLRVGVSAMMLTHGLPKLLNLISGDFSFGDPLGLGSTVTLILTVIAEALCPVLIIFGIRTRLTAIPPAFAMAVAAFIVHDTDPFATKEKALLFLVAFIAIALLGPGKYAIGRK